MAAAVPILFWPSLLPALVRPWAVAGAALTALGTGSWQAASWPRLKYFVWLFAGATAIAWLTMPTHDDLALGHFAGIALGLLAMGTVGRWCHSERRLTAAAVLFVACGVGAATVGLASISVDTTKFINTANTRPRPLFTELPRLQLGLAGLKDGRVNTNALGGTALILMPMCVALMFLPRHSYRARFLHWLGAGATMIMLVVLAVSLSRTAWLGAWLLPLVFSLCCRGRRRVIGVTSWLLVTAVASAGLLKVRSAETEDFDIGVRFTQSSVQERLEIWRAAVRQLKTRPFVGVGINQFHPEYGPEPTDGSRRNAHAHAHNQVLQVALDIGLIGLLAYAGLQIILLRLAWRAARTTGTVAAAIAGGAGLSLAAAQLFGAGDAIALGAKVGLFEWIAAGLVVAAWELQCRTQTNAVSPGAGVATAVQRPSI